MFSHCIWIRCSITDVEFTYPPVDQNDTDEEVAYVLLFLVSSCFYVNFS